VPVVRLTEVFRQAAESRVITNAHRINQGRMPEPGGDPHSDFHLVRCQDPEDGIAKLLEIVARRIPTRFGLDRIRDVQVLCPMNRGGLGARSLNVALQQLLNPPGEARVERFGWTFGPGDKVMQVVNDYQKDVFNGDLGLVRTIDAEAGELVVDFEGRDVAYDFGELDGAGAGLRHYRAQGAGLGVPGRGDPGDDAALPDAAAESALHRCHTRAKTGRPGGSAQGRGYRGQGTARAQAMVEAAGVAGGEPRGGRGDRRNFAIIRGGSGGRQEVDLGDDPIETGVTVWAQGAGQPRASRVGMPRCSSQLSGGRLQA
jgi:hypothetical protein